MAVVRDVPAGVREQDEAADRGTLLRGAGVIALGYAVGASVQSAWIYAELVPDWADVQLWRRLAANGVAVVGLVGALAVLGVHRVRGLPTIAARLVIAAATMAWLRTVLQVLLGVHPADGVRSLSAELVTGAVIAVIAGSAGAWAMVAGRRARASARAAEREAMSVELALRALEAEEIRVRRQVAEGLHGTVQQRLLLVDARLAAAQDAASQSVPSVADEIGWARAELAESRERDVRRVSRLLYPERLEMGVAPAVRALLSRLPATIATRLDVGAGLREVDDPSLVGLTIAERLLAVRVVEEAVTNALKNGPPSAVEVRLDVVDHELLVRVENDGAPFEPPAVRDPVSGTSRLDQRLRLAGGRLAVSRREPTGAVVEAALPLGVLPPDGG
ncbi:sensor histidine kinase [Cellulomonas sp. KH9]|uniref:sensor histidine kinase n=1 Tax=Cellulomonas sp. KH9 TaxID=1855324 RepID=UPI0008EA1768|nr:ATP-binding protein [Cellulomonas sp. KH9]SFK17241.1 hypothetical protein SAMN05216467_2318 [Cellulomonas sp. KH9]